MPFTLTDDEVLELTENPDSMIGRIGVIKYNTLKSQDPDYFQKIANSSYLSRRYNKNIEDVLDSYEAFSEGAGYSGIASEDAISITNEIKRAKEQRQTELTAKTFSEGMQGAAQVGKGQLSQNLTMMGLTDPIFTSMIEGEMGLIDDMQARLEQTDPGPFRDRIESKLERSKNLVAGSVLMRSKEIKNFMDAQERIESAVLSKGFKEFQETGDIPTGVGPFSEFLSGLLVSQTVAQAPTILKTAASGPGAPITVFSESLQQERIAEMIAHLQEKGIDFNSEESLRNALNNEDLMNSASSRGFRKGFPIAVFSALSAGIGRPSGSLIRSVGKEVGTQAGLDVLGEVSGQFLATGDVDPSDVFVEVLAGTSQNVAEGAAKISSSLLSSRFKDLASTPDGKPMTAEDWATKSEAIEEIGAIQALETQYEKDLIQSAMDGDEFAQQQAAELVQEINESNMPIKEQETIALKKEEIQQIRQDLGLEDLPTPQRIGFERVLSEAKRKNLDQDADFLAAETIKNPRVLTPEEQAGLTLREAKLKNDYQSAINESSELAEQGNQESSMKALEKSESILAQMDVISKAADLAGTEAGRALSARKIRLSLEDYSLASLVTRAQAFKGGQLTPDERKFFSNLSDRIKDLEAEIAKLETELNTLTDEMAPDALKTKILEKRIQEQQAKRDARRGINEFRAKTAMEKILDVATLPRSLLATADMSATLRQGLLLSVSRPTTAAKAFTEAFKAFFSQHKADEIDLTIKLDPRQVVRDRAGLYLTPMDRIDFAAREETFASTLAERIPVAKHLILASERHMVATLNMLRSASFDQFAEQNPDASIEDLRAWADYVNKASGRGNLGRAAGAAQAASIVFFAPRFAISRFQAPLTLVSNVKNPTVRNAIAKDFAAFLGLGGTALVLASLRGMDVGTDPEDSDFGKIIWKDTRIDIWGSFQQPARLAMQPILAGKQNFVEGETDIDLISAFMQFVSYKMSPTVTIPAQLLTGEDMVGEDRTALQTLGDSATPLIVQETIDTYSQEQSPAAAAGAFGAAFFGIGVSSFEKEDDKSFKF